MQLNDYLTKLYCDLRDGNLKDYRAKDYSRYFHIAQTPKRGRKITPKDDVIREKAFGNLEERLDFRRMKVSSELSLNGKLFVEFAALVYLSYVKMRMQEAKLFDKWTMQGLLDDLDTIELFEAPDHGRVLGEITQKQVEVYRAPGVEPPSL